MDAKPCCRLHLFPASIFDRFLKGLKQAAFQNQLSGLFFGESHVSKHIPAALGYYHACHEYSSFLHFSKSVIDVLLAVQHSLFSRSGCRCSLMRISTEHILIVRGLRAVGSICLAPSSSMWGGISHCWFDRKTKKGHRFRWPFPYSPLHSGQEWCGVVHLRASDEHCFIVRVLRAQGPSRVAPFLTSPSPNSPDIFFAPSSAYQSSSPCRRV